MTKQSGYLVLADISGYTAFVAGTELDHGGQILESLTRRVVEEIRPPLRVQEIEGDAVFAYARADDFDRGIVLVEVLESIYTTFRSALDDIAVCSTCSCRACGRATDLDLKFVVHYGEVVPRRVGSHTGIGGPAVIAAHRLLKNGIRERHSCRGYAFLTEDAVDRLGVRALTTGMAAHDESYEHLGRIDGFVYDLGRWWDQLKAARDVRVATAGALLTLTAELPAPLTVAWEVQTNPQHRQVWLRADRLGIATNDVRLGAGTVEHCVHGKETVVVTTLDWKPLRYVTQSYSLPLGGRMDMTRSFEPTGTGTRVTTVFGNPYHDQAWKRAILQGMVRVMGRSLRAELSASVELYHDLVRQRATADTRMESSPA